MTDRTDFSWSNQEEPHSSRQKEILAKYPQIKKLYGNDLRTLPVILGMVAIQWACIVNAQYMNMLTFGVVAWIVGGTISHSLSLANHELSHCLCFETASYNEILGCAVNLVQGIPAAISFKKYHLEHHQRQGYDKYDVDIPTNTEANLLKSKFGKFIFLTLTPFFYALRPLFTYPKPVCKKVILNFASVILSNTIIVYYYGWPALQYMLLSDYLGMTFNPMAGHFIAEHFEFVTGQETYSYYGPLNYLTFNVGYHNEHHDFPRISGFNLPKVTEMAPEFYKNLKSYDSWGKVMWDFVFDDNIFVYSRIKRFPLDAKYAKEHNLTPGEKKDY